MSSLDWLVLIGTLAAIVAYGTWKSRGTNSVERFIKGDQRQKWWMLGVSIMATQASAVTFLSTTGQGIDDGLRFIQFYFGLPLAMVILSATLLPIYYRLKVYTAYEYLETRFDLKTRTLAAFLFLMLRGLSVGITLFAPALVLSTILGWSTFWTTVLIGVLVIVYTVTGGNAAVSLTQRWQMAIILTGMAIAGGIAFSGLPEDMTFIDSVKTAGVLGKLNIVTTSFSWNDRYNIWSGLLASTFLFLSYFGTDQSQVARYIGGKSLTEGRMGLMFNGLLKIPFQLFILFIGVLVFLFYLFHTAPVFHNEVLLNRAKANAPQELQQLEQQFNETKLAERASARQVIDGLHANDASKVQQAKQQYAISKHREDSLRNAVRQVVTKAVPGANPQDRDYAFLNFVLHHLPQGLVGLLLAVIFSAAMSSMASELSALASTSMVDLYKRLLRPAHPWVSDIIVSKGLVVFWAMIAITFATLASFTENLIQFVNIVGSLFYGTILGIFIVAFYFKKIKGFAVFWAALVAECAVLISYKILEDKLAFLYYNIIGAMLVVILAQLLNLFRPSTAEEPKP